jgi:hypothetical protein
MKIFHDDVQRGTVGAGEERVLEISPGRHILSASMDWCRQDLEVELVPRQEITVEIRFVGPAHRMLFKPNEAISMEVIR